MSESQYTQTLLAPADPARTVAVAPPRLSAADLIAQAEAAAAAGHARPTRRLALAAAGAVVAAGAAAAYPRLRSGNGGGTASPPPATADLGLVVPIAYQIATDPPPAGAYLRQLAATITDAAVDRHSGSYTYLHRKSWDGMVRTSSEGHVMSYVEDLELWLAPDGSGRQRHQELPPQFPDEASRRYYERLLGQVRPSGTYPRRWNDDLPAGSAPTAPLPTDPAAMAAKLGVEGGTADVIGNVAHVYEQYAVARRPRAAILTVLAGQAGIRWRGAVTDRAGRAGVAVTYDDSTAHQEETLMVFHPATGELLAYEMLGTGKLRRTVNAYLLFLAQDRTDRPG
jgi:hypothetical protein